MYTAVHCNIKSNCAFFFFSVELTTFDLPDLTLGVATSPVKGLSRKRPHRTIDITAFEKRCQDGDGKLFVM